MPREEKDKCIAPDRPAREPDPSSVALDACFRRLVRQEVEGALSDLAPQIFRCAAPAVIERSNPTEGFITLRQAAARVQRSARQLSRWRADGLHTYGPRNDLVDPRELDEFVRSRISDGRSKDSDESHATAIMTRRRSGRRG
jgi:hypothetical protein